MSDYLWDKTGDGDAEAERLEELLGQLRFQQPPFDLPAELPATSRRARNLLSWPRLAVAASLTLALLAGAWLILRQQTKTTNETPRLVKQNGQTDAGEKQSVVVETTSDGGQNGVEKNSEPATAPSPKRNLAPRESLGAGQIKPRRPNLAGHKNRLAPREGRTEVANRATPKVNPARREEVARALTTEEREAAEKVLYALRLTSEKLNYARRQVQGVGRNEPNR